MNLFDKNTIIICPICLDKNEKNSFTVTRGDIFAIKNSKKAKYFICSTCGLMILDDDEKYQDIYSDLGHYHSGDEVDPKSFIKKRFETIINLPKDKSDNFQRIDRINKFLNNYFNQSSATRKNILDIGGGLGVFIYNFLKPEWSATIIEPVSSVCDHLQEILPNVKIINGYLSDLKSNQTFDLITLNRVLEHIHDPSLILNGCQKYLKESSLLYIEVPDSLSFYNDGKNNEAFGYGHYHVYSSLSLKLLMEKTGYLTLTTCQTTEPSGKFTLYGFFKKK